MDVLDVARWQFGITTVYHFLFVPITLGLAPLIAIMQTIWLRTGDERWLRATKFSGKLFLINFAMGVVTGSCRSSSSGCPGAPTPASSATCSAHRSQSRDSRPSSSSPRFLGFWIFGWDRLPRGIHLTTSGGGDRIAVSAWFILTANAFMQHPLIGFVPRRAAPR